MYTHIYTHTYKYTHTHVYIETFSHACIHVCTHTHSINSIINKRRLLSLVCLCVCVRGRSECYFVLGHCLSLDILKRESMIRIFVHVQVEARSYEVWGGKEGLEREYELRGQRREKKKEKQYAKEIKGITESFVVVLVVFILFI